MNLFLKLSLLLLLSILAGCSGSQPSLKTLAKSDIDMVADSYINEVESLTRELAFKLYKRNPRELQKISGMTINDRLAQLFSVDRNLNFPEVEHKQGVAALLVALDADYQGDRVFALSVGLLSMLRSSYNNQAEFFMLDSLDPQKLYNSARNIEILVWRLKNRTDADGRPLLLTNSLDGEESNLSYERLFGKLIAHQDMLARIAAQKWERALKFVVQSAATSIFLPVGL